MVLSCLVDATPGNSMRTRDTYAHQSWLSIDMALLPVAWIDRNNRVSSRSIGPPTLPLLLGAALPVVVWYSVLLHNSGLESVGFFWWG